MLEKERVVFDHLTTHNPWEISLISSWMDDQNKELVLTGSRKCLGQKNAYY